MKGIIDPYNVVSITDVTGEDTISIEYLFPSDVANSEIRLIVAEGRESACVHLDDGMVDKLIETLIAYRDV